MTWAAGAPVWVVPGEWELVDCYAVADQLAEVTGSHHAWGQLAAVGWVCGFRVSPVTQRDDPLSAELVRSESWAALCGAASPPYGEPPPSEWQRFGVSARPAVAGDAEFSHGAWSTLAWLLGHRPDPPAQLPRRAHDGTVAPGGELYITRPDPSSPVWVAAQQAQRVAWRSEAIEWQRRVRRDFDYYDRSDFA